MLFNNCISLTFYRVGDFRLCTFICSLISLALYIYLDMHGNKSFGKLFLLEIILSIYFKSVVRTNTSSHTAGGLSL